MKDSDVCVSILQKVSGLQLLQRGRMARTALVMTKSMRAVLPQRIGTCIALIGWISFHEILTPNLQIGYNCRL